jgi:hypothetical protein
MNKIQKVIVGLSVASTVGLTYVLTALKGIPEAFDWEEDDDER